MWHDVFQDRIKKNATLFNNFRSIRNYLKQDFVKRIRIDRAMQAEQLFCTTYSI
ncbi:hypothetical protein KH5_02050 [Urechidicola sp. KH5]